MVPWCNPPTWRYFKGSAWQPVGTALKSKDQRSRFQVCEILGIDGATNYEKGPEMSLRCQIPKCQHHLCAHFRSGQNHLFSQSFGIKNSCIDGINPTYSPHLEILHFKHTSNFQFQICEILGIRGATRHDTPLWCHAEFWCQNTQKPAPSILYAHFRSGAESSTFNMV